MSGQAGDKGNKKTGAGQGKAKAKAGGKADKKQLPKDMDSQSLWREGQKMKQMIQSASCASQEIVNNIKSTPAWDWGQGHQLEKVLLAQKQFKDKLSEWQRRFILAPDASSLKKDFSTSTCDSELQDLLALKVHLDNLIAVNSGTVRAHNELQKLL